MTVREAQQRRQCQRIDAALIEGIASGPVSLGTCAMFECFLIVGLRMGCKRR